MKRKKNIGLAPGTVVYTGSKHDLPVVVNYVAYNETDFIEEEQSISENKASVHKSSERIVQWYDVRGLHNIEFINFLAQTYSMHPLAIENAVDVHQRPIYQEYQDAHFISLKHLSVQEGRVVRQTISIYFGHEYLISFQEDESDVFGPIRQRIKDINSRVRKRKADYLAFAILDFIVDQYFGVLDQLEEDISRVEWQILDEQTEGTKAIIYQLKKELIKVRKSVVPLREAIGQFSRSESDLIEERTQTFIRDLFDHTIQITDNTDVLRDTVSGLHDLYLSEVSLKMNKIMQLLTVVTTIFVPLSFLTGLYGMNFKYIPELGYHYGYFVLWGFMLLLVVGMLAWFRRKRWM